METATPPASPHRRGSSPGGSQKEGDGLNLSQLPSVRHAGANSFSCGTQEDERNFKPPLSVIVIQAPTPSTASLPTNHHQQRQATLGGQVVVATSTASAAGTTSFPHASTVPKFSPSGGSSGASPFRLQPRNPAKCIPSPSRSMCSRGRKRRAYSMSTPDPKGADGSGGGGGGAADGSVATETTFRESSLGTPLQDYSQQDPNSPRLPYMESAVANFQGLSLQSPIRFYSALPNSADPDAGSPGSLFGSQASMARSCFSKYTATSPAGSLTMTSPCSPAHSSTASPKIAPLTVLAHNVPSSSASSQLSEAAAVLASPTYHHSSLRPPRHHGGMAAFMQSLDESANRGGQNQTAAPGYTTTPPRFQHVLHLQPPNTVHCHHEVSTPESALSHQTPVDTRDQVPLPHLLETPPSKQCRTVAMDSPGKRSVTSKSPTSTPLPRLTLTPRTSASRPRDLFPNSLPPPSELGVSTLSEFDSSSHPPTESGTIESAQSETCPPLRRQLSPLKKNSYIPLPDWGEPKARVNPTSVSHDNIFYENSTSLLAPPAPNDAIEQFLKHTNAGGGGGGGCIGADNDSLSASDDDDETFFLAAPSVIHEEKEASVHQIKHRKLRAPDEGFRSRPSFASSVTSIRASNTSLRGMNFVTSCTSLDKEGGFKVGVPGATEHHVPSMHRPDSESSIGLPLEGTNAPSPDEPSGPLGGGGSRSSEARDLVTPPVMTQPKSPPPLSPRIHYLNTGIGSLPPRNNTHHHHHGGSSPPSWPCSGEADSSPFTNMFSRVMFASTDPDDSPHSGLIATRSPILRQQLPSKRR